MTLKPKSYLMDIYFKNQDRIKDLYDLYLLYLSAEEKYNKSHEDNITKDVSAELKKINEEIEELRKQCKDIERVIKEQNSVFIDVSSISLKKVKKRIGY